LKLRAPASTHKKVIVELHDRKSFRGYLNPSRLGELDPLDLLTQGRRARGIEVAAKRLAVVELNNHLFVGAGWSAKFSKDGITPYKGRNLHGMKLYVMLSAKFLSTYCF